MEKRGGAGGVPGVGLAAWDGGDRPGGSFFVWVVSLPVTGDRQGRGQGSGCFVHFGGGGGVSEGAGGEVGAFLACMAV